MNMIPRIPQDGGEPPRGYFAARWHGEVPLGTLLWRDMLLFGTLLNLATSFSAIVLLGLKMPVWVWFGAYLSPLPYNLFLVIATWKATAALPPAQASGARMVALVWLAVATLI